MRRTFQAYALTLATAGLLTACHSSHEYAPSATPTNLASYAARAKFPANAEPTENAKITATVNPQNGQLTIRNFSPGVLTNFNLWVNQSYVIHVDKIDANGFRTFDPALFYNSEGNSLSGVDVNTIKKVQIVTPGGDLTNVQGPQMSQ